MVSFCFHFGQVFNEAHKMCVLVTELSLHDLNIGDGFDFFFLKSTLQGSGKLCA